MKRLSLLFLLLLAFVVAACGGTPEAEVPAVSSESNTESASSESAAEESEAEMADDIPADWPETFTVGFFGGDDADEVVERNEPFKGYLEEQLGIPVEIFTGTSYTAVIEAMRADRVDAMLVGAFSYTLAVQEADAEALAVSIGTRAEPALYDPELPAHYFSVIFTKKGSGINSYEDLVGSDFNFVDPASTSGHLMPRTTLIKNGIDPDDPANDMTTVFAGSHPTSVISVWNDKANAGATFENNLYRLRDEGQVEFCGFEDGAVGKTRTPEEVKAVFDACPEGNLAIIGYSDPIPNTPFAVRTELPDSFKAALQDALIDIKENPELVSQTARWFVNPSDDLGLDFLDQYYNPLRDLATLLDLDLKELADPRSVWPEKIVIGFFGGDDANETLVRNEPFAEYLSEYLELEVEMFTGTSYTAVIEAMRAGRVDAMEVGPFSYVLAVQEAGAEAMGVGVYSRAEEPVFDETLQPYYYSVIFTKKGSGIAAFEDIKGRGFNFVDPASTSGHLMPRTTLIKNGVDPDDPGNDITAVFAGSHPTSVLSVWNDKADAGATYESNLYSLAEEDQIEFCGFADGETNRPRSQEEITEVYEACPEGSMVIIGYSDPIPSTPFAVRSDLPFSLKNEIRDALLDVKDEPELVGEIAHWYVDPSPDLGLGALDQFYNPLRDIATLLDLDLKELADQ